MAREKPIYHYGNWSGGRLHAQSFAAAVKGFPEGTPLAFTVQQAHNGKTLPQNAFVHWLFQFIADEWNKAGMGDGAYYTKARIKAYCKSMALYPVEDFRTPHGEVIQVPIDTRDLTKDEASFLIENMYKHFAEEWQMRLPQPHEQHSMDLGK
jgi:hypothetical protein